MFQDPILSALGSESFTGVPAVDAVELLPATNPIGLLSVYTLFDSIAGSDCKLYGYKMGVILRALLGKTVPTNA